MSNVFRFSELRGLPPSQRKARIREFCSGLLDKKGAARLEVNSRIASLERQHGMTSEEMRQRFSAGQLEETGDICRWLILLSIRDELTD